MMLPMAEVRKQFFERQAAQRKLNFETTQAVRRLSPQADVYPIRCEDFDISQIKFEVNINIKHYIEQCIHVDVHFICIRVSIIPC